MLNGLVFHGLGNSLEKALRKIGRDDIVNQCIFNVELVTDDLEKAVAKTQLDQTGFDSLRDELGVSRGNSTHNTLQRNTSLDVSFDEQDLMKVMRPRGVPMPVRPRPPRSVRFSPRSVQFSL